MTLARAVKNSMRAAAIRVLGLRRCEAAIRRLRRLLKARMRDRALGDREGDARALYRQCANFAVPVNQPLILISQVQRSGGTLLSQLFDGHPQVHAHPHELKIGYPKKWNWPLIDPARGTVACFKTLFEMPTIQLFREGYRKGREVSGHFLLPPSLQRHIFLDQMRARPVPTLRDVFDAYMTSYFNAWLNNRNIAGEKRIVAGFVARMAMDGGNMERFFEIYPDGRHIAVLRDPRDWYVSARAHMSEYGDVGRAVAIWSESARAMLRGLERYGPARVRVMRFEDLIGRTEPVMRSVAEFAGIDFDPVLLEPTFNGEPIRANSSFAVAEAGILSAPLERRTALSEDEREAIDREAGALHGQVCELALPRTPTGGGRPACEVTSG